MADDANINIEKQTLFSLPNGTRVSMGSSSSTAAALLLPRMPRKSILKQKHRDDENNTMPILSTSRKQDSSQIRPADRRVSFAEKVQLHKIDIVPFPNANISEADSSEEEEDNEKDDDVDDNISGSEDDMSFLKLEADADKIVTALKTNNDGLELDSYASSHDIEVSANGGEQNSNNSVERESQNPYSPENAEDNRNSDSDNSMELTGPQLSKFVPEFPAIDSAPAAFVGDFILRRLDETEHDKNSDALDQHQHQHQPQIDGNQLFDEFHKTHQVDHDFPHLETYYDADTAPKLAEISNENANSAHQPELVYDQQNTASLHVEPDHAPSLTSSEEYLDDENDEDMEFTVQVERYTREELTMDLTLPQPANAVSNSVAPIGPANTANDFEATTDLIVPSNTGSLHNLPPDMNEEQTMELTKRVDREPSARDQGQIHDEEITMDLTMPQKSNSPRFPTISETAEGTAKGNGHIHDTLGLVNEAYDEESAMELTQPVGPFQQPSDGESLRTLSPILVKSQDTDMAKLQPSQTSEATHTPHVSPSAHKWAHSAETTQTPINSGNYSVGFSGDPVSFTTKKPDEDSEGSRSSSESEAGENHADYKESSGDKNYSKKRSLGPPMKPSPTKRRKSQSPDFKPDDHTDISYNDDWNVPDISLPDFLNEVGITFYDDLEIATDVSLMYQHLSSSSNMSTTLKEDYYKANIQLPLLEVYELSCKELSAKIQQGKILFEEVKEKCLQNNPDLFKRYLLSSPYEQMSMKTKFHLVKELTKHQAKQVWYEWRTKLVRNILQVYEDNLENLKNDKALVDASIDALEREFQTVNRQLWSLRLDLQKFKEIQSRSMTLDVDAIKTMKATMSDLNRKLIQQKTSISSKEKSIKAVEDAIEQLSRDIRTLNTHLMETEGELNKMKHFNSKEIDDLQVRSRVLEACTGLQFIRKEGDIYEFELDPRIGLSVDSSKLERPLGITCHLLESKKTALLNENLASAFLGLVADTSTTSSSNVSANFKVIWKMWHKFRLIDREIYWIFLKHPIAFQEVTSRNIKFTVSFFSLARKTKVDLSVSIPLAKVLLYPAGVAVEANVIKGEGDKKHIIAQAFSDIGAKIEMFTKVKLSTISA